MAIGVEMSGVHSVLDAGDPRRRNLFAQKFVDINDAKPHVIANVHIAPRKTAESIGLSTHDQPLNQIASQVVNDTLRKGVFDLNDTLEKTDLICSVGIERGATYKHFVDQNTEGPVVDSLVVTLRKDDFRRKVFWCSAQRICLIHNDLGETEVDKNTVTPFINENIFWFKITVANTAVVKVSKGLKNTSGIKTGVSVRDTISCFGMNHRKQLATLY
mmetsp:Transcript_22821/g.58328  ORF Transcript_22821/g.58328 Transcript_22821/m.58328 type:complete len:216 (-) Transcript_22821:815-1462(-)